MLVFDRTHFDVMTGADRALQLEVLSLFRTQVAGWNGDGAPGWREGVHAIKGAAQGIGLFALAAACEAAEQASENERLSALVHMDAALEEALSALEQFAAAPA